MGLKNILKSLALQAGYKISRYNPNQIGICPFSDMKRFLGKNETPLIFDVGANVGQSIEHFKSVFPCSTIHAFEPNSRAFNQLKINIADKIGVSAWNEALGSFAEMRDFYENEHSEMSSFLELSRVGWGKIGMPLKVKVNTIDNFLKEHNIWGQIDILKSDAQGYDLEVFKGAENSMKDNRIKMLYSEFIFSDMYKGLPKFDEVFKYLSDRNFSLVSMYKTFYQNNLASWTDMLWINKEFHKTLSGDNKVR